MKRLIFFTTIFYSLLGAAMDKPLDQKTARDQAREQAMRTPVSTPTNSSSSVYETIQSMPGLGGALAKFPCAPYCLCITCLDLLNEKLRALESLVPKLETLSGAHAIACARVIKSVHHVAEITQKKSHKPSVVPLRPSKPIRIAPARNYIEKKPELSVDDEEFNCLTDPSQQNLKWVFDQASASL